MDEPTSTPLPSLDALQSRIDAVRGAPEEGMLADGNNGSYAWKMALDLLGGVLVGLGLGYATDWWLGTKPFGMLFFLLLGSAAGFMNVVRSARRMQENFPATPGQAPKKTSRNAS